MDRVGRPDGQRPRHDRLRIRLVSYHSKMETALGFAFLAAAILSCIALIKYIW